MDFATLFGLILAVSATGGAFLLEGGNLDAIFLGAPILLVVGGTLGATMVTTSTQTVLQVPNYLRLAFQRNNLRLPDAIDSLVKLAEKARREGILGLENDLRKITDPFFYKAVQLLIDGTEVTVLREILETEMSCLEQRHKRGIVFFQKAGGFAPTLGILGTVLGLVHTLGNATDASKMASSIAGAFIATLWGVGLANLFFLPVSDKLKLRHEEEMANLELIMEGVVAIQSGENPRNIRTRLLSFVAPSSRREER
ncbi:MAG: flagellar motor protein [candidate division Zixibacteria bacterium]|nr:flagellar motor protein [candidate division Zixibacteria bacterium]